MCVWSLAFLVFFQRLNLFVVALKKCIFKLFGSTLCWSLINLVCFEGSLLAAWLHGFQMVTRERLPASTTIKEMYSFS